MASHLPTDVLMHIGDFLLHRDARCMQATCVDWRKAWATASLRVPHPCVRQIEVCHAIHCFNRRHIIKHIEPMLLFGKQTETEVQRMLYFMALMPLVELLVQMSRLCRYPGFQVRATTMQSSLTLWCRCRHRHSQIPVVCIGTWTPEPPLDLVYTDIPDALDLLIVWSTLWCMLWLLVFGMVLIPSALIITTLSMVLVVLDTILDAT